MTRAICTLTALALFVGCEGEQPKKAASQPEESFDAPKSNKKQDPPGKPQQIARKKPDSGTPAPVSMGAAIRDLTSEDAEDRLAAIGVLLVADLDDDRRQEVAAGLTRRLADANDDVRDKALAALRKWGRPEDAAKVIALLSRNEEPIRHAAMRALIPMKTPEAAEALAARLQSAFDRRVAVDVLQRFGSTAEEAVLAYVEDGDPEVRLAVVRVLARIGTSMESRRALDDFQMDPDPRVAREAARSL